LVSFAITPKRNRIPGHNRGHPWQRKVNYLA
jgi:hypothetical protein